MGQQNVCTLYICVSTKCMHVSCAVILTSPHEGGYAPHAGGYAPHAGGYAPHVATLKGGY